MDKKKIETFGEFCELIEKEPENVYTAAGNTTTLNRIDSIKVLYNTFNNIMHNYYHIPPKKKIKMCQWYDKNNGQMFVFEKVLYGSSLIKIPDSEFEVED